MTPTFTAFGIALSVTPDSLALYAVSILLAAVLVLLAFQVARLQKRLHDVAAPIFEQTVHDAQKKAEWVLVDARQQAMELRLKAQKEAEQISAEREKEEEVYRESVRKHIEELSLQAQKLLENQGTTITQLTERIGTELTDKAREAEVVVAGESESVKKLFAEEHDRMRAAFATIESRTQEEYEKYVADMQKQMSSEMTREIEAARAAAAKYRAEKLAVIEREVVMLVEDTVRLALGKTLSLEEHRDIVLKALVDAKAAGVFTAS